MMIFDDGWFFPVTGPNLESILFLPKGHGIDWNPIEVDGFMGNLG